MEQFLAGFLLATLIIGGIAWHEVNEWTFTSAAYRNEIQAFMKQQNDFMEGMIRAGFLKIEVPTPSPKENK